MAVAKKRILADANLVIHGMLTEEYVTVSVKGLVINEKSLDLRNTAGIQEL
jgi:hypothetical protein